MSLSLPHGFKRWSSIAQVRSCQHMLGEEWRGQQAIQKHLLGSLKASKVAGYCAVCERETEFEIHDASSGAPNWRETMACAHCGLINRWRASLHLYRMLGSLIPEGPVYITEQTTAVYAWLAERLPGLIGSEFVSSGAKSGATVDWNGRQLRHEDVTQLSMASGSLAALLTFDVLEHVPGYRRALAEFARVLMPGGMMLFTAPFLFEKQDTVVRAEIDSDGSLVHRLPEIYHGDPLSKKGVLCFQEFGWDLLDDLISAGFSRCEIISCWAPDAGYYGNLEPFVIAWR